MSANKAGGLARDLLLRHSKHFESLEDDDRKLKRREKNRVAAQRSRKKQTQKADRLHEEYEYLEHENSSLQKEVEKLTDELRRLTEALKAHEPLCPLLHCAISHRPEVITNCLPR
ncbi:basic leucine zipper transcriptional factor ATF-like 3 [Erpetoichthys calabaricus]|uniref:basic leucine zipper transcriptional factor ATF-like 3 n=1 Tax=Erpetoichthys calabaricus TaxID=27687 RepID=UPI0010A03965|nr:basic leucine zipper transcriptional factor ATF-like 3 [Erpetoichthys calabaricus]